MKTGLKLQNRSGKLIYESSWIEGVDYNDDNDNNDKDGFIDASFAVHGDICGHTGAGMTLGKGSIQNFLTKQKINTRSSTELELVGFDDVVPKILWTKLFMEAQGYDIKDNIAYRDNQSSMNLAGNGKSSSTKQTRHFNIKYFFVTDLIQRGGISIEYCSTDNMWSDYHTKLLFWTKVYPVSTRYNESETQRRQQMKQIKIEINCKKRKEEKRRRIIYE
jgi:hypothetical protein